jgi:hypothetical protein
VGMSGPPGSSVPFVDLYGRRRTTDLPPPQVVP